MTLRGLRRSGAVAVKAGIPALLVLVIGAAARPAAPGCEVEGAAAGSADAARARAACEIARGRFAELLGEPVPGVRVVLRDRPGYRTGTQGARAAVLWPTSRTMAAGAASAAAAERHVAVQWREVLPHEIAHALLAARFHAVGRGATGGPGYGTPLPDWLDEGVAIWAEPIASRRRRLEQARALPPARRDLRTILTAAHPAAGSAAARAARDGAALPADPALRAFYPQSIAVLAFVYDAGGRAAVRALVRRWTTGAAGGDPAGSDPAGGIDPSDPAGPEALDGRAALAGLPGLPADFGGVVAAWEAWLAAGASRAGGAAGRAAGG